MKNTLARILAGSIAALLAGQSVSANTYNATVGDGSIAGYNTAGGLNLGTGASNVSILIQGNALNQTLTFGDKVSIGNGQSNNTITVNNTARLLSSNNTGYSPGSFQVNGTNNKLIVSGGAQVSSQGYCTIKGTNNEIQVSGAGSLLFMSADPTGNDGFEATTQTAKLTITNGGTVLAGNDSNAGLVKFCTTAAAFALGNYACTIDGAGSTLNVLSFNYYDDYSAANIGGVLHATNGGALEIRQSSLPIGYDAARNTAIMSHIKIDGGELSYKGTSGVNMGESTTAVGAGVVSAFNLTWAGNNAMRLNNSASTDTGSYTLTNTISAKNYVRLEMINGTTSVARAITVDGANGGSILFDGTTATIANGVTLTGAAVLTATGTASSLTGVIGSSGSLTKTGTGSLTLTSANTYTGATAVNVGTLKAGVASVAGVSGAFGLNSAVTLANTAGVFLDITGFNTQIGTLAGGGLLGGTVTLGTATLTVNEATATTYSGAIAGTGGTAGTLLKKGAGTLSLNGVQTYGTLTTDEGTTIVNSAVGTGASTVNANAGTTMKFGTVSQTLASLNIGAGATVTFTSGPASFSGDGKATGFGGGTVVPEPGTLGLLLVGALGVLHRRRRAGCSRGQ